MLIHYYVSGHGFGHATRVAEVCRSLIALGVQVIVTTSAPAHLFPPGCRLRTIDEVDAPIVQPLPYEIDAQASLDRLIAYLGDDHGQAWLWREELFNDESGIDAILFDAPFLAGSLATPDRPALLVSNFAFDAIYRGLRPMLELDAQHRLDELIPIVDEHYSRASGVVLLPGAIDMPFMQLWQEGDSKRSIAAPLVYRRPRRTRSEARQSLGIDQDKKVVLVQFGGHTRQQQQQSTGTQTDLPAEEWLVLSTTTDSDVRIASDFYMPDAVVAADVVLGKIGYGTVSECVGIGTPLVYVKRPGFAEEPGLIRYLDEKQLGIELERADFEQGMWSTALQTAVELSHGKLKQKSVSTAAVEVMRHREDEDDELAQDAADFGDVAQIILKELHRMSKTP